MKIRTLCSAFLVLLIAACTSPQAPEQTESESGAGPELDTSPMPERPAAASRRRDELRNAGVPQRDTTPVDAKIVKVNLSNSGDTEGHTLGMPVSSFSPNDTVYAEIQTTGTAGKYDIYAKWVASDGVVLADYGMRVAEAGPKRTVISLSKPDGWPLGTHSIELAVNGKTYQVAKFQVR